MSYFKHSKYTASYLKHPKKYGELPKTLQDARIADTLLDAVWVNDSKKQAPKKTAKKTKTRARNSKGHYVPDDPSTPENEAFVEA